MSKAKSKLVDVQSAFYYSSDPRLVTVLSDNSRVTWSDGNVKQLPISVELERTAGIHRVVPYMEWIPDSEWDEGTYLVRDSHGVWQLADEFFRQLKPMTASQRVSEIKKRSSVLKSIASRQKDLENGSAEKGRQDQVDSVAREPQVDQVDTETSQSKRESEEHKS